MLGFDSFFGLGLEDGHVPSFWLFLCVTFVLGSLSSEFLRAEPERAHQRGGLF